MSKREELKEKALKFVEKVNNSLPGIIELEFRGLYERGIFIKKETGEAGAKKRYALMDEGGNLEIRGFESVRRDWCELSKKIQREVLLTVLKDKNPEKAFSIVKETIQKLKNREVDLDDLIIYEQITKPLNEYEQISPHVIAAKKARERGREIGEGMVIGFIIVSGSGSISERAEPAEDVKIEDYDIDYYIRHQIVPAAMRILKAFNYKESDLIEGIKQRSLFDILSKKSK